MRRTIAGLAVLALLSIAAVAWASVSEPWTPDMNQESYWEARFGADCTKYENHSGYIPVHYDWVIVKSGSDHVTIWSDVAAGSVVDNGINPANGKPYSPPYSWVMKCNEKRTSTTESTTTTRPETTSTTQGSTTSTSTEPSTTTTPPSSSTTEPSTSSTTEQSTTSTTALVTTTTVGGGGSTSTLPGGSSTSLAPTTSAPTELPFTGGNWPAFVVAGIGLLGLGTLAVKGARDDSA